MGAGVGCGILQAANNNKIMLALAAANTFFIFMVDFLFVRSWFGRDTNSPLPDKRKKEQPESDGLFIHHKQNTPQPHPSAGECLSSPLGGGASQCFSY
jgi:hypothetical protein